jgi:hypothetical protein
VFEDGSVVFIPVANVKARQRTSWTIRRSDVAELRKVLAEAALLQLHDQYQDITDPECVQWLSDNATVHLTIRQDGGWKFIRHYLGCRGSAAVLALEKLEDDIDRIAMARKGIG